MGNRNKRNPRSSVVNQRPKMTESKLKVLESDDLDNQQKKLTDLKESLEQKELALESSEQELKTKIESISQQQTVLNKQELSLQEKELQAKNDFPKLFEEKFAVFKKQLEQREAQCVSELELLEAEKAKLRQRELEIKKAEIEKQNGYADDRAKLDEELFNLRKNQEMELESKRVSDLEKIEKEILKERKSKLSSLEQEIADRQAEHETSLQKEKDELEQKRKVLQKDKADLDDLKDELEYQKQRLQSRKDSLEERETNLNVEVDAKVVERKQSFEYEKSSLNDEIARLRESNITSNDLISNFEELKHKLGGEDPASVLLKLKTYEEEIKRLREDLAIRPTLEMQEAFDRMNSEKSDLQQACERLAEENYALRNSARDQSDLEMQIAELSDKNKSLVRRFESVDADNNRLMEELKRLQTSYEREQDREARIRDIEVPYIQKKLPRSPKLIKEVEQYRPLIAAKEKGKNLPSEQSDLLANLERDISAGELEWLDEIRESCINYGLRFPRRILHAFHTALKTSEWSPVTVLAGVSGTGKSELPRLYSHFGGINFLSLSVQPNWDSQESMLGFFNSIDNKFDAQPILKLLAQSQKKQSENFPLGLEDAMNLVLMDEMNLAHVELYFAEFLSKLELRRGCKGSEVPNLEVKLGAGIEHYGLPLGRNVLWAGTMNQDETTKSLSDKVLDRGTVINFPRPTTLERRRQLKPLGEQAPLLSRKLWESWWCRESKFSDEQILPFKRFVEELNTSLSTVGRALGHRVWQSIEYYMANYPDVLEAQRNNDELGLAKAMKIAFEDQLVQKVMPKLRGIETRGKSKTDCLDKIRSQLVNDDYSIVDDFDWACSDINYGQFIWNSANYLKDDEPVNGLKNITSNSKVDPGLEPDRSKTVHAISSDNLPEALVNLAGDKSKKPWQLSIREIKEVMGCDAKTAKEFKELCNKSKDSK